MRTSGGSIHRESAAGQALLGDLASQLKRLGEHTALFSLWLALPHPTARADNRCPQTWPSVLWGRITS